MILFLFIILKGIIGIKYLLGQNLLLVSFYGYKFLKMVVQGDESYFFA